MAKFHGSAGTLDVLVYRFLYEMAALAAFRMVMHEIHGGAAYRLRSSDGTATTLVVFAIENAEKLERICEIHGGMHTSIRPELLRDLAARSESAAVHSIVGTRHYEPGITPGSALPTNPNDYTPKP